MERERELALVARLRAGDLTAFDDIFDAFNYRLLGFLMRMAKNRCVAEDLLEETWLRLVSSGEDLCPDTQLGAWLFTVARNLYVSHCRNRAREQSYAADLSLLWPSGPAQSPFDLACVNEFEQRLEAALGLLPPIYREVLLLVGVEGLRPVDAARVCRISPETLRQRLSRARQLMLQLMTDAEPFIEAICEEVNS
ncbi:MAG TPA: RNA polymerase sigma factor [Bryobacteraceae bacterium]|jgi:RNA polymerase sigma-70 factor (ECF subfamily)